MADYLATVGALRGHLETNFTALPVRWPNDSRDADLQTCPNGFVYSEIEVSTEGPATIGGAGNRTHRDTGTMYVLVYVPLKSLPGIAEQHASALRDLFNVNSVPGVNVTSRAIGRGEHVNGPGGRFYSVPLTIAFFSDRIE